MAKTVSGPPRRPDGPGGPGTPGRPGASGGAGDGRLGAGDGRLGAMRRGGGLRWPARLRGGRPSGRRPSGTAVLFAVVGVAIVAVMAWAVLGSRLLVVRSVQVVGAGRAVSVAQVLAAAQVRHGLPLIRVDTGAVARQIERLRQVQSAQVSKDWPSTIVITVRPRTPVFVVHAPNGYALVDRFGVSVSDAASRPPGFPLLSVGDAAAPLPGNPAVQAAATVLGELPPKIARQARTVAATSSTDVSVTLADGAIVVWGDTGQAGVKAKELSLLMRRHARRYDVSGHGAVVVSG